MKIAVITDGNVTLGLGHVYQSITLAKFLKQRANVEVRFFTKSDERVCSLIKKEQFDVEQCKDDCGVFAKLKEFEASRTIFDSLNVPPWLSKKIKHELPGKLVIFTNLTAANEDADMTVLADVNYKNVIRRDNGKVDFLGPRFWILRDEFYIFKGREKEQKSEVKDVMLIFGGADPENLSFKVLKELLECKINLNVVVVVGASYPFKSSLEQIVANSHCKIQILSNVANVAELMFKSDLVFTSPGLTFFEALVVGTPVVCFHQNEQQKNEFLNIFPTLETADLASIPSIIESKSFLTPNDIRVKNMQIGEGRDEILEELLS